MSLDTIKIDSTEVRKVSFDYGISLTQSRKFLMLHKMKRIMLDHVGEFRGSISLRLQNLRETIESETETDYNQFKASEEETLFEEMLDSIEAITQCVTYLMDQQIPSFPGSKRYK